MRASAWCYIVMWLFLTHSWHHTKHYSIDCTDYLRHFERLFLNFGGFNITYLYLPTWNQYTECFMRIFTIYTTVKAKQIFSTHRSSYFPWQQTLKSFPILFCFSLSRHPCFACFSLFYRQSVNIGESTRSLDIRKLKYL